MPVVFKVLFQDNIEMGLTHPLQIFRFTSRCNFSCGIIDKSLRIEETWINKMKIRFNIIKGYYRSLAKPTISTPSGLRSDVFKEPLVLYLYKHEGISFTLKTNKPFNDSELLSFYDFEYYLKQDEQIIDLFFKNHFESYFGNDPMK